MAQTAQMHALNLDLTEEQKRAIQKFWSEHGAIGTVDIKVHVAGDRISPASIQVGTAK
jgi:hypothetical protein